MGQRTKTSRQPGPPAPYTRRGGCDHAPQGDAGRGRSAAVRAAALAGLCLAVAACQSGSGSSQSGATSPSPSPAAVTAAPDTAAAVAPDASPPSPPPAPPAVPPGTHKMLTDPATRMVYLPTTGWLTEDQFWDVYFHHAEKLTVDLDFPALTAMGYRRPDDGTGGHS